MTITQEITMDICIPFEPSLATPHKLGTTNVDTEVLKQLTIDLRNKTALIEKLEHLLSSARHENDNLRHQLAHDPAPDMETVPLDALLEAVQTFLDEGQALKIYANSVSIIALETNFQATPKTANNLLDAAAALARVQILY